MVWTSWCVEYPLDTLLQQRFVNFLLIPAVDCFACAKQSTAGISRKFLAFYEISSVVRTNFLRHSSSWHKSLQSINKRFRIQWIGNFDMYCSNWKARKYHTEPLNIASIYIQRRTTNGPKQSTPTYVNGRLQGTALSSGRSHISCCMAGACLRLQLKQWFPTLRTLALPNVARRLYSLSDFLWLKSLRNVTFY